LEQTLNAFVVPDAKISTDDSEAELAAGDAAADLQAQESAGNFRSQKTVNTVKSVAAAPSSQTPLISMEQATKRLGPKVLAALDLKFKGSLTQVRHPDENDMFF
jgi:hypothetical protein